MAANYSQVMAIASKIIKIEPFTTMDYMMSCNAILKIVSSDEFIKHENSLKLYNAFYEMFESHVKAALSEDTITLEMYDAVWRNYYISSGFMDRWAYYINTRFATSYKSETPNIHPIMTLYKAFMHIWKNEVILRTNHSAAAFIHNAIEEERRGGSIPRPAIERAILSYQAVELYRDFIEEPFIANTSVFYRTCVSPNPDVAYFNNVAKLLRDEEERRYIPDELRARAISLFDEIFIKENQEILQGVWRTNLTVRTSYMDAHESETRRSAFRLLKRLSLIEPLAQEYEAYVKQTNKVDTNPEKPADEINELLAVVEKINDEVARDYENDGYMRAAADRALMHVINDGRKINEIFAKYVETSLRSSLDDPHAFAHRNFKLIFKFLENKDVFQRYYAKMLARRLVGDAQFNEDQETYPIMVMREISGNEYVRNIEGLIKDYKISGTLNEDYQSCIMMLDNDDNIKTSYSVLATSTWPLNASMATPFIPAMEVQSHLSSFETYYMNKRAGRKLIWLHEFCRAEIKLTYTKPVITVQLSSYQLAVLTQFNGADELTMQQLQLATGMPMELLIQIMEPIVKSGILIIDGEQRYKLRLDFKPKKTKININVPIKIQQKAEDSATDAQVENERRFVLQAMIVRIMKMRKTTGYNLLISEVAQQASTRFTPTIPMIKREIAVMIDKEYIRREEAGSTNNIHYIA